MSATDLKNFVFDDQHEIRVITIDGEPWFVAADVCAALKIRSSNQAVDRLDSDEKGAYLIRTPGGDQKQWIVTEPGLYKVIVRSRAATTQGTSAHAFTRWVTHDVLPSIRKTGSYSVPERLALGTATLDNKAAYAAMSADVQEAWRLRRELRNAAPTR